MDDIDYGDLLKRTLKLALTAANVPVLIVGAFAFLAGTALTAGILTGPIALGLAGASLKMARGQPVTLSDLGSGFGRFVPALLLTLLLVAAALLASLAFFVPGLFVLFFSVFAYFELAEDPSASALDAAKRALALVKDNLAPLLVVGLVEMILMGTLGQIVLFEMSAARVGALVVIAFAFVLDALLYLRLKHAAPAGPVQVA